jgi:hypothetical protein
MMGGVSVLELEGRLALGFDTGLSAGDFAKSRAGQYITDKGFIVEPGGSIPTWQTLGVAEAGKETAAGSPAMVIWGPPAFAEGRGLRLDELALDQDHGDEALEALRRWIRARRLLGERVPGAAPFPWPCGAWLGAGGAYFFPPERFVRWSAGAAWLEGAERWSHPDLAGERALVFTGAALLYAILCGVPPFTNTGEETLHSDIREGVFLPPELQAPGLNDDASAFLSRALSPARNNSPEPLLAELEALLGERDKAAFFHPLAEEERTRIDAEKRQYDNRKQALVRGRRFVRRNRIVITVAAAAVLGAGLIAYSLIRDRAARPNTLGMSPWEVVEAYYGGINALDTEIMDGCVTGGAGKDYINAVTNFYVVSRIREAYEMQDHFMSPEDWLAAGALPTQDTVFGITGLSLESADTDDSDGALSFWAGYTLWVPGSAGEADPAAEIPPSLPEDIPSRDLVILSYHKDRWLISAIEREAGGPGN